MSIAMINDILFGKFGECTIGNTFSDSAEKTSGFEISVRGIYNLDVSASGQGRNDFQ